MVLDIQFVFKNILGTEVDIIGHWLYYSWRRVRYVSYEVTVWSCDHIGPTLKLKRPAVVKKYEQTIEKFYEES